MLSFSACRFGTLRPTGVCLLLAMGLWSRNTRGAEPLELSWQAPSDCPQEAAVREQIAALVPPGMLEGGQVQAEGKITRVDARYRLELVLKLGDVRGERSIDSDSCNDLAGAAAVALGLLLQATVAQPAASPPAGGDQQPSSSAPAPSTSHPSEERATRTPAAARSWRVVLHAPQLALDLGPLPQPALGLAAAAGLSLHGWLLAGSFQWARPQHLDLEGADGAGADVSQLGAELWTCRSWRASRFELGPCLLVGLERVTARGTGAEVSVRSEQAMWATVGAAGLASWRVSDWFAVAASASAKLETARPTIRIEGLEGARRLGFAALGLRLGPMWIF